MLRRLYRIGIVVAILGSLLCLPIVVVDTIAGASSPGLSCNETSVGTATFISQLGGGSTSGEENYGGSAYTNNAPGPVYITNTVISCSGVSGPYVFGIIAVPGGYDDFAVASCDWQYSSNDPAASLPSSFSFNLETGTTGSDDSVPGAICAVVTGYGATVDLALANNDYSAGQLDDSYYPGVWQYSPTFSIDGFSPPPATGSAFLPSTLLSSFAGSFSSGAGGIVLLVAGGLVGLLLLFWAIRFVFNFLRKRKRKI